MRIKRIAQPRKSLMASTNDVDLSLIDSLLEKYKTKKGAIIPILQGVQEVYGYIPRDAFIKISNATAYSLSELYGVATFYAQFRLAPVGKHIIKVCHGTACHVQNATEITQSLEDSLNVADGETTEDGIFTLESVACLGCCSLAPVMMIGDETYGNLTGKSAVKVIKEIARNEKAKK